MIVSPEQNQVSIIQRQNVLSSSPPCNPACDVLQTCQNGTCTTSTDKILAALTGLLLTLALIGVISFIVWSIYKN